ncbi:Serine hydrolase-like protein 2 [Desmophyllum pertusum]|uniref:Serine hydrolase-like protein 2 n=1 Tax=Desmophyllum pertusum TaxID=174260 RepID=A0A9W9ZF50_9CNID|nr:Serine hydrolase-like protein 2 [Desmophyllum pertusum]
MKVENLVLIDYGGYPAWAANKPAEVLARYATKMTVTNLRTPRFYESVETAAARREEPSVGNTLRKEDALLLTERGTRVTQDGVIFSHDPVLKGTIYPFFRASVISKANSFQDPVCSVGVKRSSLKLILSKIQCAVLVLEGTDSYSVHNSARREERKEGLVLFINMQSFKMWKNVQGGHYLHLDNPEQIAQEIKQFLALCHDLHRSKL